MTITTPIPMTVSKYAKRSMLLEVNFIETDFCVGTTTIMLGATRYGPSAPSTRQIGRAHV